MINVYDFDFNILHIEPKHISTKWNLYFNDIGTFEAHFPLNSEIVNIILENKFLVIGERDKFAIIIGYDIQNDFAIYGRTCNWLLTKRVAQAFNKKYKTSDQITRELVSDAFSDVSNFVLGDELIIPENIEFSKDSTTILSDTVIECLKLQNVGHRLIFDVINKRWLYENIKSNETDLILSVANKNAYDIKITNDILDLADCGYFEKEIQSSGDSGQTAATQTTYVSTDTTNVGIKRWETILNGSAEADAKNDLLTKKTKEEITLKAINLKYGVDYKLGDIVRVQIVKGGLRTNVKKRICGVEITNQTGSKGEQPIFEEV